MSRQPELLYLSFLLIPIPPSRCFHTFGNLETKADFDAVINTPHLIFIQSADVLFDATFVDSFNLLKEHHRSIAETLHIFDTAVSRLLALLPDTRSNGGYNQRGTEKITGIILQKKYRPGAALLRADIGVKICKINIAAAIVPVFTGVTFGYVRSLGIGISGNSPTACISLFGSLPISFTSARIPRLYYPK